MYTDRQHNKVRRMNAFIVLLVGVLLRLKVECAILQIPALGRTSDLSFFYNMNTDEFYPVPAITGIFPQRSFLPQMKSNVECTSKIVSSLDDRLTSIGLDLRGKVDVMAGAVGISGSIAYANENQYDSETTYGVVHYRRLTMYETFHSRLPEIQSMVSLHPAKTLPATHIVLGILWGVDIAISFQFHRNSSSSSTAAALELEASLSKLAYSVEVGGKAGFKKADAQSHSNTNIKIYGDIVLPSIPKTMEDVEDLLQKMPELLEETSGKGSPQLFQVIEVGKLQTIIDYDTLARELNNSKPISYNDRNPNVVEIETALLFVFNQKEETLKDLSMWRARITKFDFMFESKFLKKINHLCSKFESTYIIYQARFKHILQKCRLHVTPALKKQFQKVKNNYMKHKFGPFQAHKQFNYLMRDAKSKYFDYLAFKKGGVNFASKEMTVNQLRLQTGNATVIFLFYTEKWKQEDYKLWNRLSNWIVNQSGLRYVVDCNLRAHFYDSCENRGNGTGLKSIKVERYDGIDKMTTLSLEGNSYFFIREGFSWKN